VAVASFEVLALLGLFRLEVVLLLGMLVPTILLYLYRGPLLESLRELGSQATAAFEALRRGVRARPVVAGGIAILGLHLALRMARAIVTPSLGWDDFTYHLFRAGLWVQNGSLELQPSPDAWSYYELFPRAGDIVWAWALVWGTTDVLVPVLSIGLWALVAISAYVLARSLQQSVEIALIVALGVALFPSQITLTSTAYVDNALLWLVLVASICVRHVEANRDGGDLQSAAHRQDLATSWILGASVGLGTIVKLSFLPILGVAALVAGWYSWRKRRVSLLLAFGLGAFIVVPNLVFNFLHRGSPFYPFRVLSGLPFNEQLTSMLGTFSEVNLFTAVLRGLIGLTVNVWPGEPFLNFGWLGLVLIALGLAGATTYLCRERKLLYVIWTALCAALILGPTLTPENRSLVAYFTPVLGRLWLPGLASLMILSGSVRGRIIRWLVLLLLLMEYFFNSTWQWPQEVLVGTVIVSLVGLGAGLASRRVWRRKLNRPWRLAATTILLGAALFLGVQIRELLRYDIYQLSEQTKLGDFQKLSPGVTAWPIWQRLDEQSGLRVAATAGFAGRTGHTWFRYPLLGSRLQNRVLYLPITADGRIIDYADTHEVLENQDREAWLERLLGERVDYVVAMMPRHVEHVWIEELPSLFSIEQNMGGGRGQAPPLHSRGNDPM
jgi:4-amino-4-deoxy-L-arabinose transferase-like glycosyltransferase